jgi:hypothetical protein
MPVLRNKPDGYLNSFSTSIMATESTEDHGKKLQFPETFLSFSVDSVAIRNIDSHANVSAFIFQVEKY